MGEMLASGLGGPRYLCLGFVGEFFLFGHSGHVLSARRQEKRVTVRAPMRPEIRNVADKLQRHARALHTKYFPTITLRTIAAFADVFE